MSLQKKREETICIDVPKGTAKGAELEKKHRFQISYDMVRRAQVVVDVTQTMDLNTRNTAKSPKLLAELTLETSPGIAYSSNRPLTGVIKHAAQPYWELDVENQSEFTFKVKITEEVKEDSKIYFTAFLENTKA